MNTYTFSEEYMGNLRAVNPSTRKDRISKNSFTMSTKTQDFIQKICYRKTASVDMTQYGFISDCKLNPIKLMMKPLRAQLKKIRVKVNTSMKTSSTQISQQIANRHKQRRKLLRTPKSALHTSGTNSPRPRIRKVRIKIDQSPKMRKTGNLMLPGFKKKKKISKK